MGKKILGKDGKIYKELKPFYKRWWFWLIITTIIVLCFAAQFANEDILNPKKTVTNSTQSSVTTSSKKAFYGIGDSVEVEGIIYTLNSVELTDERNHLDDTNPEYVVKISYMMENNSGSEVPVGMDLSAYGPDNKKLESYPNKNTMGSVATEKKIDVVENFSVNSLGKMEFQFSPLNSVQKTANFKVNIQ